MGRADYLRKIDVTGDSISHWDMYTLLSIRSALSFQRGGMRWSRNTPMGTTLARKMLGLRGNHKSLYEQVDALITGFGGTSVPWREKHWEG